MVNWLKTDKLWSSQSSNQPSLLVHILIDIAVTVLLVTFLLILVKYQSSCFILDCPVCSIYCISMYFHFFLAFCYSYWHIGFWHKIKFCWNFYNALILALFQYSYEQCFSSFWAGCGALIEIISKQFNISPYIVLCSQFFILLMTTHWMLVLLWPICTTSLIRWN